MAALGLAGKERGGGKVDNKEFLKKKPSNFFKDICSLFCACLPDHTLENNLQFIFPGVQYLTTYKLV